MNLDFTEKKKHYLFEKKNRAEGFTWNKSSCASSEQKKKIRGAWKFPSPLHHFSNGPSLSLFAILRGFSYPFKRFKGKLIISWGK